MDPDVTAQVGAWLGLEASAAPLPAKNEATRHDATDPEVLRYLEQYFVPHNEDLFELLGQRLWEGRSASV